MMLFIIAPPPAGIEEPNPLTTCVRRQPQGNYPGAQLGIFIAALNDWTGLVL